MHHILRHRVHNHFVNIRSSSSIQRSTHKRRHRFYFYYFPFFYDKDTYFNEIIVILLLLSFCERVTRSYAEADMHIEKHEKVERIAKKHLVFHLYFIFIITCFKNFPK